MNDDSLRATYQQVIEQRGRRRDTCVSPEALLAVAEGTAGESDQLRVLNHVGACPHCRTEFDLLRTAVDVAERVTRPAWYRTPLFAAAASFVLLAGAGAVWWSAVNRPSVETIRSGVSPGVVLIAPPEDVAVSQPVVLVWSAVDGARSYQVEVLDSAGTPVFDVTTTDTTVVLSDDAILSGVDYRWWVRAAVPGGLRPSQMRRLRLDAM